MTGLYAWLCLGLVAAVAIINLVRLHQTSIMLARRHRRLRSVGPGTNSGDEPGTSERLAARLGQMSSFAALATLVALMGGAIAYSTVPDSGRRLVVDVVGYEKSAGRRSGDQQTTTTSPTITTTTESVGPTTSGPPTSPTSTPSTTTSTSTPTVPREPRVSIADASAQEGDSDEQGQRGDMAVALQLSATSEHDITLQFETASGTATVDEDYSGEQGSMRIAAGQRTAVIRVYLRGDDLKEADEFFRVLILNSPGVVLERAVATGVILDDD